MIGLAYLALGAIYVVAMVCLVGWAWRQGRKLNRSVAIACAALAFLSLYLPVFWDFIPTIIAHRYYCAKDAGIVVKMAPEQWLQQHASEIAELRIDPLKPPAEFGRFSTSDGWDSWYTNKAAVRQQRIVNLNLAMPFSRIEQRVVDARSGAILASHTDYHAGISFASGGLKLWNYMPTCDGRRSQREYDRVVGMYRLAGN